MSRRLHTYIYSLIYPAVLGSFLFAAITRPAPGPVEGVAAALMGIYFMAQYGEGVIAASSCVPANSFIYDCVRFIQDLLEILALIAVFAALGFFQAVPGTGAETDNWLSPLVGWHWASMAIALAIPPVGRLARCRFAAHALTARETRIGTDLMILSAAGIVGCLFGWAASPAGGLLVLGAALCFYMLDYVFVVSAYRSP